MQTITSEELLDNLAEIVQCVRAGEYIRVMHRSKPAFILKPERGDNKESSSACRRRDS